MNYPIILVPGILGSMGDDIVPGTGEMGFGLAQQAYDPILENLETLGYARDKNLFVAFYDWRKKNRVSAEEYLIPEINRVKDLTGSDKVNLICHSMGGLVARSYIQSDAYKYDVDKLVLIGTPNSGSAKAYYFWEGGEIPSDKGFGNLFYNLLWDGYTWMHKIFNGKGDDINIKRELVPSIKELMPSKDYGDFLFTVNSSSYGDFIPYDKMVEQNTFLNELNRRSSELYRKNVKMYLIAGEGQQTEKFIRVAKTRSRSPEWIDGKPESVVYTESGDGTVISNSVTSIQGTVTRVEGDHVEILANSKDAIASIFDNKTRSRRRGVKGRKNKTKKKPKTRKNHSLCMILATNVKEIYLESRVRKYDIGLLADINRKKLAVDNIGPSLSCVTINQAEFKGNRLIFIPRDNAKSDILVLKRSNVQGLSVKKEVKTEEVFTVDI